MKDSVLKNKVIKFLYEMAISHKTFPQTFTARETAEAVHGVMTRIGFISNDVIKELNARGIQIVYISSINPRKFVIKGVRKDTSITPDDRLLNKSFNLCNDDVLSNVWRKA